MLHALPCRVFALCLLQEEAQQPREPLTAPLKEAERHRLRVVGQRQRVLVVSPLPVCRWRELPEALRQLPVVRELHDREKGRRRCERRDQ